MMKHRDQFVDNIAGQNWHPRNMSREITWEQDAIIESFDWPAPFGILFRFLMASFGALVVGVTAWIWGWWALLALPVLPLMSNRLEPMPAGKNDNKHNRWPAWVRWYWWHVRNPGEDLKKYFLGFGRAKEADYWDLWNIEWNNGQSMNRFRIWLAQFARPVPFTVPFPYFKHQNWSELMWGWKSRGILSFTIRRND